MSIEAIKRTFIKTKDRDHKFVHIGSIFQNWFHSFSRCFSASIWIAIHFLNVVFAYIFLKWMWKVIKINDSMTQYVKTMAIHLQDFSPLYFFPSGFLVLCEWRLSNFTGGQQPVLHSYDWLWAVCNAIILIGCQQPVLHSFWLAVRNQ